MSKAPILFINQLTTIDFSYLDPTRGLLGESWLVDIELEGVLNEQAMLFDFSPAKKVIKQLIDNTVDHKLLVPKRYTGFQPQSDNHAHFDFQLMSGAYIRHQGPDCAVTLIDAEQIDINSTRTYLQQLILEALPDNIQSVTLRLYPETIHGAYYHYSHGLKKHDGNCQRIAHGHRSQIQIYKNQQRDAALEQQWAQIFQDIYIGTKQDLIETSQMDAIDYHHYRYHAAQGEFALTLPAKQCYLIDSDSTVEEIATHIAEQLAAQDPHNQYTVYAYEGVNKGAIAKRN